MGCNCGKKAQQFKNLVQQGNTPPVVSQPPQHITREERSKLRAARISARAARVAARNAAILRQRELEEAARKNIQ